MKPDRRKRIALASLFLCATLVCLFFALGHSSNRAAFSFALYGLLLISSFLQYRRSLKHRQPDTLIHLFPTPPDDKGKI